MERLEYKSQHRDDIEMTSLGCHQFLCEVVITVAEWQVCSGPDMTRYVCRIRKNKSDEFR